jgi:hypothetical protein
MDLAIQKLFFRRRHEAVDTCIVENSFRNKILKMILTQKGLM